VYNALARDFDIAGVVIEKSVPRGEFLRKRVKRLGVRKVAGQLAFASLAIPLLERSGRARIEEIRREYELDLSPPPAGLVRRVDSVNAPGTAALVKELSPSIVVIHGTRILSKRLLGELPPYVFNIHAGITPRYRGVHGGYWALAERDRLHCGVTVHLVDPGIDTGRILAQERIEPLRRDNFATYPYLQLGVGLRLLRQCVRAALENRLEPRAEEPAPSRIWSHPTLLEYGLNRLKTGTK
jgi:methionyl-tRNA formyltransferase